MGRQRVAITPCYQVGEEDQYSASGRWQQSASTPASRSLAAVAGCLAAG
jgi:hypothetical protein